MLRWYDRLCNIFQDVKKGEQARFNFLLKVQTKVRSCIQKVENGEDKTAQAGFFASIVKNQSDPKKGMTLPEMDSNALAFLGAGSETTATILSGATYLLLSNPHTYKKLVHEIRSRFSNAQDITAQSCSSLEYLIAVCQEALRIYPPVPTGVPRIVPQGGAQVSGMYIPGGYTVLCPQWPTNHSTRNFEDPEAFVPERWLNAEEYKDDKLDVVQPFGIGPTTCLGKK